MFGPQTRPPGPMDVLDLHRLDLLQCGALQPGTLEVLPVGKKKQQKIAVGLGMGWNWTIFGLRDISWREKFEGFFFKGKSFFLKGRLETTNHIYIYIPGAPMTSIF